ncbi:MAG: hypothetical protein ACE5FZ_08475 [Nitrospiria bacterium]
MIVSDELKRIKKTIRFVKDKDAAASIAFICEALRKLDKDLTTANTRSMKFKAQLDRLRDREKVTKRVLEKVAGRT